MVALGRSASVVEIFWTSFFTLRTCWQSFLRNDASLFANSMSCMNVLCRNFHPSFLQNFRKSFFQVTCCKTLRYSGRFHALTSRVLNVSQNCLSMLRSQSDSSSLMLLDGASSSSSFSTHSFNSFTLSFMSCWIDSFFSWRFIENSITSGFVSLLSDYSDNFAIVKNLRKHVQPEKHVCTLRTLRSHNKKNKKQKTKKKNCNNSKIIIKYD